MRWVRWALVIGWVVLTVSLFWDPLSSTLTRPDNQASPFRLDRASSSGLEESRYSCPLRRADDSVDWRGQPEGTCDPRCAQVQGECVIEQPYAMGARLFWTILVPIVPFFLLVFGHEAWRRICPLSAIMQIPRKLGIQRKRKTVNPGTGLIDAKLLLPRKKSWLERNFWFLQFTLLILGVSARLVFINSDRMALGVFFIGVMVIAMAVGYLYGGKTWCNYICPLSPVQKIYTEPRGLLESEAHTSGTTITQSMCRQLDDQGNDMSACVGCKSPCPDTDLERQYWSELEKPGRRFFYYGYLGMVIGFYTYYTLYAGNWDYYFSGSWTHEEAQLDKIFAPGLYFFGQPLAIPKLIAAPLSIFAFVFASYLLGRGCEAAYASWMRRRGRPLEREVLLHRCYTVAAVITFNTFYFFGGRPNLRLLPGPLLTGVDVLIIAVSMLWGYRSFFRSSERYQRESVVESLRRQLGKLKLDFSRMFGGRSLADLSSDEVYVLAKTLPNLSQQEKRRAYKDTLREALSSGHGTSGAGLAVLREIRDQMEISE
ncbi:MAG: 4Fe-4S binding protein, partial [Deltaproteobacteria bacterium]|nr:4Fe-4S binding protein [Deltaproteobacteria bacterium]